MAQVWGDGRPPPPAAPLRVHKLEHAGEGAGDKLARMRIEMAGEWVLCMLWCLVLPCRPSGIGRALPATRGQPGRSQTALTAPGARPVQHTELCCMCIGNPVHNTMRHISQGLQIYSSPAQVNRVSNAAFTMACCARGLTACLAKQHPLGLAPTQAVGGKGIAAAASFR